MEGWELPTLGNLLGSHQEPLYWEQRRVKTQGPFPVMTDNLS